VILHAVLATEKPARKLAGFFAYACSKATGIDSVMDTNVRMTETSGIGDQIKMLGKALAGAGTATSAAEMPSGPTTVAAALQPDKSAGRG
jgi:hypothetical protein